MNVQTYIALGLLVISIAFYLSIPYQVAKPKLLFGRAVMDMGPDLFPRIAAIRLAAASVLAFIQGLVAPEKNPFKDIIPRARRDIAIAFEPLGFIIASICFTAGLSVYLGNRNIVMVTILSVGVTSAVFLVFTNLLHIALPEGVLSDFNLYL